MNKVHIAIAIFVGFCLIATSILLMQNKSSVLIQDEILESPQRTTDQHIYGNPDASTIIVEFSDLECPFCSRLHTVLKDLVDESNSNLAWEYRHLPLGNHPNAFPAAVVGECVAKILGEQEFFTYLDKIFAQMGNLNQDLIKNIALDLGVKEDEISNCQNNSELIALVESDIKVAESFGARGTPFSVIVGKDGKQKNVSGALPKEQWSALIESVQ